MGNYFVPLTRNAIGAASKTQNSQRQMALLDQCKTVAESALQLLYAAKEGGGNPKVRWLLQLGQTEKDRNDVLSDGSLSKKKK